MDPSEEITHRSLNHYALLAFKEAYWALSSHQRADFQQNWLTALRAAAQQVDIFQATESGIDLIIWSATLADEKQAGAIRAPRSIPKRARSRRLIPLIKPANPTWSSTLSARALSGT
jgi:hypothetical protein